jgi:hypothetical protein
VKSKCYIGILLLLGNLHICAQVFGFAKQFGGPNLYADQGYGVRADAARNVYSVGHFNDVCDFDPGPAVYTLTSVGGSDIYVSKLDNNGNFVWVKQIG